MESLSAVFNQFWTTTEEKWKTNLLVGVVSIEILVRNNHPLNHLKWITFVDIFTNKVTKKLKNQRQDQFEQKINLSLPGLMADTGMIRWPINFPPSSKAAILREARVGRITCQTVSVNSSLMSPPTAAIITVLSDSPFWRQLAPRPTLGLWHYCSGRSWSSVLFFLCLQEVRTFLPLHTRPPAARSETVLKSPDTQIKKEFDVPSGSTEQRNIFLDVNHGLYNRNPDPTPRQATMERKTPLLPGWNLDQAHIGGTLW